GDRAVRLPEDPLEEAAELAIAFNGLAAALATSEGRQRDFLLSVSHELRTPLTSIKGYAEALADGVVAADGAQRAGQTMLADAERLDRLIADRLGLALAARLVRRLGGTIEAGHASEGGARFTVRLPYQARTSH